MKPLVLDVQSILIKLCEDTGCSSQTTAYLLNRYEKEGMSFLTKTLPKLVKSVFRCVEMGYFGHQDRNLDLRPTDFAWKGKSLAMFREFLY